MEEKIYCHISTLLDADIETWADWGRQGRGDNEEIIVLGWKIIFKTKLSVKIYFDLKNHFKLDFKA